MTFQIYMLECPLGRRYVGCTRHSGHHRLTQMRPCPRDWPGDERACIEDAIGRFGRAAITVKTLATTEHRELAVHLETHFIDHFGTAAPNGYNRDRRSNFPLKPYAGRHWRDREAA